CKLPWPQPAKACNSKNAQSAKNRIPLNSLGRFSRTTKPPASTDPEGGQRLADPGQKRYAESPLKLGLNDRFGEDLREVILPSGSALLAPVAGPRRTQLGFKRLR